MCSVWLTEQTVIIPLYRINWLVRVRCQVIPCHLWWSKRPWDIFFSQYFCFPLSVSFHQCCIIIIYTFLLPEGQTDETWETSKKAMRLRKSESIELSLFFFVWHNDMWVQLWCTTALGCFSLNRPVITLPLTVGTLTLNKLRCYCMCCSIGYLVMPDIHCVTWVHGWSSKRISE